MPFADLASLPPVPVGGTPLFNSPAISIMSGFSNLWFKDDGRNPSASLKDRASAVAIAMAKEAGKSTIAAASTGNAASSLATLAASVSMKAVLFVPRTIPKPKLAQLLIHDAEVICLDFSYDRAFELCQTACEKYGWYSRNTAVNPFTGEGKKTAALEIASDLGWAPDAVICPVGDGCIIGGLYKGFYDLMQLGMIEKMPRLYGIQASGAAPLVKAYENNAEIEPIDEAKTIADSISVGYPRDGFKALRAVRETDGTMSSVADNQILGAQKILAARAGIFVEPAAAAALAGLLKLKNEKYLGNEENMVVLLTGHGLKDVERVINNIKTDIDIIKPDIDAITKKLITDKVIS
jgi:threonine synthase